MQYNILDICSFDNIRQKIILLLTNLFKECRKLSEEDACELAEARAEAMRQYILDESAYVVAAFADDEFVGFAWFHQHTFANEDSFHLTEICVAEEHQDKGIGRTMIDIGIKEASNRSIDNVDLFVSCDNTGAISLFESLGFESKRLHLLRKISQ